MLCFSEIGSEHGKSLFLLLSKMKLVPSLDAQKDMVKWVLQVGFWTHPVLNLHLLFAAIIYLFFPC